MMAVKRSDYKTKAEYKWAVKQERAAIKPFIYLALAPFLAGWIFSGNVLIGVAAAVLIPLLLFGLIVMVVRAKQA